MGVKFTVSELPKEVIVGSSSSLAVAPAAAQVTDVVSRAQRGDEAAFAALYEAHKRTVYSLCSRMTRSPADAETMSTPHTIA